MPGALLVKLPLLRITRKRIALQQMKARIQSLRRTPMGRRQMAQPLLPQMRQLRRAQQALLLGMPGAMLPRLPPPRMPRLAVIQRRMMEVNRMPPHMQRISQASSLRMRPQSQRRRMTQPKRTRSLQTLQSRLMTG